MFGKENHVLRFYHMDGEGNIQGTRLSEARPSFTQQILPFLGRFHQNSHYCKPHPKVHHQYNHSASGLVLLLEQGLPAAIHFFR